MTKKFNMTYYQMLGISPYATQNEVEEAYKEISRVFHDKSNFFSELIDVRSIEADERIFRHMTRAYETLMHPQGRADYDASLSEEERSRESLKEDIAQMLSKWNAPPKKKKRPSKDTATFNRFGIVPNAVEEEPQVERKSNAPRSVSAISEIVATHQKKKESNNRVLVLLAAITIITLFGALGIASRAGYW